MLQYSLDNLPVELELLSGHLLFIDPLYFQDIIDARDALPSIVTGDKIEFIKLLEEKFFPYSGGSLLGYKFISKENKSYRFASTELKKWNAKEPEQLLAQRKLITTFGVDTASFLLIDLDNFERLLYVLTYDGLVDALLSHQLDNYFDTVNIKLGNRGWSYVVGTASNSKSEFAGDGTYIVY